MTIGKLRRRLEGLEAHHAPTRGPEGAENFFDQLETIAARMVEAGDLADHTKEDSALSPMARTALMLFGPDATDDSREEALALLEGRADLAIENRKGV